MTDSPWSVVVGLVKTLGVGVDDVMYGMSYANAVLMSASVPTYVSEDDKGEEIINGDDPANKQRLRELFNSMN